jgi:hypothetical protein
MTTLHQNATTHGSGDRPRGTLARYFTRYRFACICFQARELLLVSQ